MYLRAEKFVIYPENFFLSSPPPNLPLEKANCLETDSYHSAKEGGFEVPLCVIEFY